LRNWALLHQIRLNLLHWDGSFAALSGNQINFLKRGMKFHIFNVIFNSLITF
jgi:hypothetical protein